VPRIVGMFTDKERAALAPKPRAYLADAERRARTAVSLFDVGIARGITERRILGPSGSGSAVDL